MAPSRDKKNEGEREGLPEGDARPQPGRPEDEALANPPEGTSPLERGGDRRVGDKPYPLQGTEAGIATAQDANVYHEKGGPSAELDRETEAAEVTGRRESRERVSPASPKDPSSGASGKHTNQ